MNQTRPDPSSTGLRHHATAAALLGAAGVVSLLPLLATGRSDPLEGAIGTRFFGYGSLVLLCAALAIGPLARLFPRRLKYLVPYRRAVGIWSAIAAAVHLLFVLRLIQTDWVDRTLPTLFLSPRTVIAPGTGEVSTVYRLVLDDRLTVMAWTGLIALAVLLFLALLSSDRAQRLLGYSAWKLLQQQAYTAFLFAALHVLIMRYGGRIKGMPPLMPGTLLLLGAVVALQVAGFVHTARKVQQRQTEK